MAFDIFAKVELSQYLRQRLAEMNRAVQAEPADYILNVNEEEYVQHLVDQYQVEPLEMRFEGVYVSAREEMIPAERHPRAFIVTRGASCPKQAITYHIPYSGTEELLRCIPNPRVRNTHEVELKDNCICFHVVDFYGNPEEIKREADSIINLIRKQLENVAANVNEYNAGLPVQVETLVTSRRKQLLDRQGVVTSLGLPVKRNSNVPETFTIPAVRKKVVPKPAAPPSGSGIPEPTIEQGVYDEILKTIHVIWGEPSSAFQVPMLVRAKRLYETISSCNLSLASRAAQQVKPSIRAVRLIFSYAMRVRTYLSPNVNSGAVPPLTRKRLTKSWAT